MSGGIFCSHGEIFKVDLQHCPTKSVIKTNPKDVVMTYLLGARLSLARYITMPCGIYFPKRLGSAKSTVK